MAFATYNIHITVMRKGFYPMTILACDSYATAALCCADMAKKGHLCTTHRCGDNLTYYLTYNADIVVDTLTYCQKSGTRPSPIRVI